MPAYGAVGRGRSLTAHVKIREAGGATGDRGHAVRTSWRITLAFG